MTHRDSSLGKVAALLGLIVWLMLSVIDAFNVQGADLRALVVAGYYVDTGIPQHLYDSGSEAFNVVNTVEARIAAHDLGLLELPTRFVQPPLIAWAAAPLSKLKFDAVMFLWTVASALALLVAFRLCLRIYAPRLDEPLYWGALLVALCAFVPVEYGLNLGQTTPLIFFLVIVAIYLQRVQRPIAAGLVLSVTIFVKVTPALVALLWLWRGPRRAFFAAALGVVVLIALSLGVAGTELNRQYLDNVRAMNDSVLVAFNNHSLAAYLTRFDYPLIEAFRWIPVPQPAWVRVTTNVTAVLVLGGAAWMAQRARPMSREDPRALLEGVALLAGLLFSPLSWTHYFVFLLPVMALLWSRTGAVQRPLVGTVLALVFLACSKVVLPNHGPHRGVMSANGVVPAPTFAALGLLALVLVALWDWRRGGVFFASETRPESEAGGGTTAQSEPES